MNKIASVAGATVLLAMLSACSGQAGKSSYDSMDSLKGAVEEAGVSCDADDVHSEESRDVLACGNGLYLALYSDGPVNDAHLWEWSGDDNFATAVGSNWAVRSNDRAKIDRLAETLDGRVLEHSASAATPSGSEPARKDTTAPTKSA